MKDSIFWRVIGIGTVLGLLWIGYGLGKNSQIPPPSFSSVAYGEDVDGEQSLKQAVASINKQAAIFSPSVLMRPVCTSRISPSTLFCPLPPSPLFQVQELDLP